MNIYWKEEEGRRHRKENIYKKTEEYKYETMEVNDYVFASYEYPSYLVLRNRIIEEYFRVLIVE